MANINEILARAESLRKETALNSIDPERAGGIMYDTLLALNELWLQQGAALVISKIYASVAAMEADTAPVSDLTGKPLRPGQIVVIASSDSDNGSVYRYNGTDSPSWSLVGNIGNLKPVDNLESDSTTLPLAAHQGKVLDGKISQLGQEINGGTTTEQIEVSSNYPNQYFSGNDAVVGNFYDLSPLALQGTMGYKIAVAAGDKYIIYGLGNTDALPLCVITDSSHIVTQIIKENSRANGRTVEIQESGTLFINLYNYNASTDKVLKEAIVLVDGLVSKVSNLESQTAVLETEEKNKKILFLPDSDFTNELTGVVDYYATNDVDVAKEYYLKICGYRENNKGQTIIQVYDGNNTLVGQVVWDASVNKVYKIKCAGFVFLIDSQFLPQNSSGAFIGYNLHLNKFVNTPLEFSKDFIEGIATPGLRWLKKPFSNNIAETKVTDSLLYISAKSEIPSGLYIRYFGRKQGDDRLYIQICDNNNAEVSSYLGVLPQDLDTERIITTTGTYSFDIKLIVSKTEIGADAFTDFRNYALNLDEVFLNAQREDGGTIEEKVSNLENSFGSLLNGKTIVCFGDSITMFEGTGNKRYTDWLQEFSGATVINCGFGGSRLTSRTNPVASPTTSTEAFAPFDISNLIEFISANDFSKLDAGLQWIINNESQWLSNQFAANLANVKSINWANVDIVTFFAGTNDKSAGAAIGVATDDNKNTIMGAVKLISRVLLTAYPHLKIYWFTPIIRYYADTVEERTPETFSDNSNLPDYVDAILTQSRNLKFPVCDLYRTLGWDQYNFSEYFNDNDGTHPYKGFKDIGLKIDKFLQSN